jgi:hypothetical protein
MTVLTTTAGKSRHGGECVNESILPMIEFDHIKPYDWNDYSTFLYHSCKIASLYLFCLVRSLSEWFCLHVLNCLLTAYLLTQPLPCLLRVSEFQYYDTSPIGYFVPSCEIAMGRICTAIQTAAQLENNLWLFWI